MFNPFLQIDYAVLYMYHDYCRCVVYFRVVSVNVFVASDVCPVLPTSMWLSVITTQPVMASWD